MSTKEPSAIIDDGALPPLPAKMSSLSSARPSHADGAHSVRFSETDRFTDNASERSFAADATKTLQQQISSVHSEVPPPAENVVDAMVHSAALVDASDASPAKKTKKQTMFVAKRMTVDIFGEEPMYTHPHLKPVPLTVLLSENKGPRRDKAGKPVAHTLLGDVEDFIKFEKQEISGKKDGSIEPVENDTENIQKRTLAEEAEKQRKFEETEERRRQEKKKWLDRLHIFQRYREIREEHALTNWKRHSIEWAKVERSVAHSIYKDPKDLLMARLGEYRERIEERDLVIEALELLQQNDINFWSPGLRIGNDLLGLMVTLPQSGPRQIERIITSEAVHADRASKANDFRQERAKTLKSVISKLDPIYYTNKSKGEYLEVVGEHLQPSQMEQLTEAYMMRLDERLKRTASKQTSATPAPLVELSENVNGAIEAPPQKKGFSTSKSTLGQLSSSSTPIPPIDRVNKLADIDKLVMEGMDGQPLDKENDPSLGGLASGVSLIFAATHMTFHVLLNEVSASVLTVHNRSPAAVHFEWKPSPRDNALKVKYDGIQRFYFCHKKGVILPGAAYDFQIIFKSASPGIFSEMWTLYTMPQESEKSETTVTFQGIAFEPDETQEKRERVEKLLSRRIATCIARETINDILQSLKPTAPPNKVQRRKLIDQQDQVVFLKKNADLHLRYEPDAFAKLEVLATEVASELKIGGDPWDRSVNTLYSMISTMEKGDIKSQLLERLNDAVNQCASTENPGSGVHSMLYIVAYDIFLGVADRIADEGERIRKKMGLPIQRSAAKFFLTDEDLKDDDEVRRNLTPSVPLQQVVPDDKNKKGAAPPSAAGGKDPKTGKAIATPAAAKAPAGKGGKKDSIATELEEVPQKPVLAKIGFKKPRKNESAAQWSPERRVSELQYRYQIRDQTHNIVRSAVHRICGLFDDISGAREVERYTKTAASTDEESSKLEERASSASLGVVNRPITIDPVPIPLSGQALGSPAPNSATRRKRLVPVAAPGSTTAPAVTGGGAIKERAASPKRR